MKSRVSSSTLALLDGLGKVLDAPHNEVTGRLSALLEPLVPHRAIASLADGCARSPMSVHGEAQVVEGIRAAELARLAGQVAVGSPRRTHSELAGSDRRLLAVAGSSLATRSLLVLVDVDEREPSPGTDLLVQHVWTLVLENLARRLAEARPESLSVSRAITGERARVSAELNVQQSAVLMSLLGVLRSGSLNDGAARRSAIDLAASALVELRATARNERAAGEESADDAFAHLRDELRPIARYGQAELSFASPDSPRPLPAQIAQAGRAVARGAVLAMLEQDGVTRIRVGWTVADDLIVTVHDDGPGRITDRSLPLLELTARAEAVDGAVELESVPDWGTRLKARLPLAIPSAAAEDPVDRLQPRERQVLELLAAGARNRDIAAELQITENTVKFHVSNVLRKLEVDSRGAAAALARTTSARGPAAATVDELERRRSRTTSRFG